MLPIELFNKDVIENKYSNLDNYRVCSCCGEKMRIKKNHLLVGKKLNKKENLASTRNSFDNLDLEPTYLFEKNITEIISILENKEVSLCD